MGSTFDRLCSDSLIKDYPSHIRNNVHYEVIMGSTAYGVSDDMSDIDIYGFTIPPKHILFPYSTDNIIGFGKAPENFKQFQQHHIIDKSRDKEYDICIYNIVKFFNLCFENNPNMVDALFVPTRCVLYSTKIGEHVRNYRKLFLSKRVWHKFKGYAFSQLHKMKNKYLKEFVDLCKQFDMPYDLPLKEMLDFMKKDGADNNICGKMVSIHNKIDKNGKRSKRISLIAEHGYDVKFGYHIVRLLDECQMILEEGDLDLTRSREHLKSIRRGEWSMDRVEEYFDTKLPILEDLYNNTQLQYAPNEEHIRDLLFDCIEMHYGSISEANKMGFNANKVVLELNRVSKSIDKINRMIYDNL